MLLAHTETTIQECDALLRQSQACRAAYEEQCRSIAKIAGLDQDIAESFAQEVELTVKMTDHLIKQGTLLLKQLVLRARRAQLCGKLAAMENCSELTASEKVALEQTLSQPTDREDALLGSQARRFVGDCARSIESCLESVSESLSSDDVIHAGILCKQAHRITAAMREIQDNWPWPDQQAESESRGQYERGELMDFETFKNELLKAAQ